ncbi:MAG: hypothetical protein FJ102_08615 [Deltaproteobacteria bacterium]|nr:hypothetical protein [Deltaproteobacteria bacterium]
MTRLSWARPVLVLPVLLASFAAKATLRRTPGSWLSEQRTVFSDGTTSPIFHPLSEPMSSAGVINVRVSTELDGTSGNCALRWSSLHGLGWRGC